MASLENEQNEVEKARAILKLAEMRAKLDAPGIKKKPKFSRWTKLILIFLAIELFGFILSMVLGNFL